MDNRASGALWARSPRCVRASATAAAFAISTACAVAIAFAFTAAFTFAFDRLLPPQLPAVFPETVQARQQDPAAPASLTWGGAGRDGGSAAGSPELS
ncbi:MAG: hypothetical protein LBG06_01680 [Deltaproteobacteria bacterium]|jgi:hypothetical protein|nr:hypothetical protein [Deltaproteobacteria bacterium]